MQGKNQDCLWKNPNQILTFFWNNCFYWNLSKGKSDMKKIFFMLFICALISQNTANAAEPHSLSVKTGKGKFIVDYTNGNNTDTKQTLNGPGTWSIPSKEARPMMA